MPRQAILALADGTVYPGVSVGAEGESLGELVFNTAMTGYQEILSDPSYCQQIVMLTYPHIGNVGCNREDDESGQVHAAGLVIRDYPLAVSNWRAEESLQAYAVRNGLVVITEIDTRALTRRLRTRGSQSACILTAGPEESDRAIAMARGLAGIQGLDLAQVVTTDKPYSWVEGEWNLNSGYQKFEAGDSSGKSAINRDRFKVVAYDFGVKRNILRMLTQRGCELTVVPAQTDAAAVLAMNPQGVFFSNGPGDPEPCEYAIEAIKGLLKENIPLFGICLGHQLLALASGARTEKMKFGHHGANHPVQEVNSGAVLITSQNHGFTVQEESLPDYVRVTHRSLFDGSVQGFEYKEKPVFGFQGHPEASPGPRDIGHLFDHFIDLMKSAGQCGPDQRGAF